MAKSKPEGESKEERRARKDAKKAAKSSTSTLTESAGVTKVKPEKKDKKEKKKREALAEKAVNEINGTKKVKKVESESDEEGEEEDGAIEEVEMKDEDEADSKKKKGKLSLKDRPIGALVPFANPLADEKVGKKMFKGVKKGTFTHSHSTQAHEATLKGCHANATTAASQRTLKRGVKEVVKALRKSPTSQPANSLSSSDLPLGIVVLAADISPMDVISHIPVLCEDHNIPYIFVTSRAELGMAGMTKRPTSVVMISREEGKKVKEEGKKGSKSEDDGEEWSETYKGLVKVVLRETPQVRK